jgi:excisionase family DNA binding protein
MLNSTEEYGSGIENPDPLLSTKEAAQYLGVKISTMYEIAKREQFPVTFVTTDRKFKRSVLDDYINSKETTWRWNQFVTL